MPTPVLLLLRDPARTNGFDSVPPGDAVVSALDLGITRGDGVFETINVINGIPQALDAHLARFERSAALLDLPRPHARAWREAVFAAVDAHDDTAEAFLKLLYSRGVEGTDEPTGWVYMQPSPDYSRERREGVSVVLLDRGYSSTVAHTSPWLLQGAKTLSYALNRAAAREAKRRGADDVIFVSTDGFLLEGPNSTVVLRLNDRLVTPRPDLGILPGTTQESIFEIARVNGYPTAYETPTPVDLAKADAAWLVSSVRNAAPIRAVDGAPKPIDAELTETINAGLASRTE